MITVSRKTGKVIHMDRLTPEQNQKAWEMVLQSHVKLHPEMLETLKEEKHDNHT